MSSSDDLEIREASADELVPLRVAVLRGGDAAAVATDPRDGEPGSLHLAAVLGDEVVGCGSFFAATAPSGDHPAYQLRYMATDPAHQGHGVGTELLRAAESLLTSRGVEELWANARDSAIGFYVATGWSVVAGSGHISEETDLPHTVVRRRLRRDDPVTIRWASSDDAADLATLRAEMMFAMRLREVSGEWRDEAVKYFAEGLADGTVLAVMATTANGEAAGSAAVSMRQNPPSPWNPTGRSAYVHTVATVPGFRHRGVSRLLMNELLRELTARQVTRVELHATGDGEPLYRELGFVERANNREMRLDNTAAVLKAAPSAQ
jgi:GNAT superfamily N-acetyltransferase